MDKQPLIEGMKRGVGAPEERDFPLDVRTDSITDEGFFEGYGSVFGGSPDSYGDIVERGAFAKTLQAGGRNRNGIALLWQHFPEFPVGTWKEMREDDKGLFLRGKLNKEVKPWGIPVYDMLKEGAIKGLSIGFRIVKSDRDETSQIRTLKEIELWEVSLVTFPAALPAQVTTVKAIKEARTERELERALREAGLSITDSKYLVSACKDGLFRREAEAQPAQQLLRALQEANISLELLKAINF